MSVYSIGNLNFIDFVLPDPRAMQVDIETRPGTDGHSLWLMGIRGKPVQIMTIADYLTVGDAFAAYNTYFAAVGTTSDLVWNGQSIGKYDILSVSGAGRRGPVSATVLGHGGLVGISRAIVQAQWTIIAE